MGPRFMTYLKYVATQDWHPTGKILKRLTVSEQEMCVEFIMKHETLDQDNFILAVNKWFMDVQDRPKNWSHMTDLVAQCISTKGA